MFGQELQAESYAVAQMNTIIHDMDVDLQRGDTMINPKFRDAAGSLDAASTSSSPTRCGTSRSTPDIFDDDPFDRFTKPGGVDVRQGRLGLAAAHARRA